MDQPQTSKQSRNFARWQLDNIYPSSTNWSANSYDAELWLAKTSDKAAPIQLTRTEKGSSTNAQFSPDSEWISFLADRGNKTQLFIISPFGGEAMPITQRSGWY